MLVGSVLLRDAGMSPNPSYLDLNTSFMHTGQFMLCQLTWWLVWLPWETTGELQSTFSPSYHETQTKGRSVPYTFYLHIFLIILSKCGGLSYQISLCNTCTNFWETVLAGITGIHVLSTHNYRCRVCLELRHKSWCGGIPAYATYF